MTASSGAAAETPVTHTSGKSEPAAVREHIARVNVYEEAPAVKDALFALNAAAARGLDPRLVTLVKLRVSQLNGCAMCVKVNADHARKQGIWQDQIDLLAGWRDTRGLYTGQQRVALALAEAGTLLTWSGSDSAAAATSGSAAVPDALYAQVAEFFTPREQAQLLAVIATINAFNRLSVMAQRGVDFRDADAQ